jgi:hypothetical protein
MSSYERVLPQDFEQTGLVPLLATRDFVFNVPEDYVPRRIFAKVAAQGFLLITGVRHIVLGRVVVSVTNITTFDRAIRLGISDRLERELLECDA